MKVCGAKTRSGGTCKRAGGPNGRCKLHGRDAGRPPTTGRHSKYLRVFGQRYAELISDPEILHSGPELALFDAFLTERAELLKDGFSSGWLEEAQKALSDLHAALFTKPDARAVKPAFDRLDVLLKDGGEHVAAWNEMLDAAARRSLLASKAQAALARQDQVMTESKLVVLFGKMLDVLTDVAGADVARKVSARLDRELFGRLGAGEEGAAPPQPN